MIVVSIEVPLRGIPRERIKEWIMTYIAIFIAASAIATLFTVAGCMLSTQPSQRRPLVKVYVQADDPTLPLRSHQASKM